MVLPSCQTPPNLPSLHNLPNLNAPTHPPGQGSQRRVCLCVCVLFLQEQKTENCTTNNKVHTQGRIPPQCHEIRRPQNRTICIAHNVVSFQTQNTSRCNHKIGSQDGTTFSRHLCVDIVIGSLANPIRWTRLATDQLHLTRRPWSILIVAILLETMHLQRACL